MARLLAAVCLLTAAFGFAFPFLDRAGTALVGVAFLAFTPPLLPAGRSLVLRPPKVPLGTRIDLPPLDTENERVTSPELRAR